MYVNIHSHLYARAHTPTHAHAHAHAHLEDANLAIDALECVRVGQLTLFKRLHRHLFRRQQVCPELDL